MNCIIYSVTSGDILKTYSGPEQFLKMQYDTGTHDYVVGELPHWEHFIESGKLVEFAEQNTYLDGHVLKSLPDSCTIKINCQAYEATGPEVELNFDQYGEYEIAILAYKYKRKDFKIDYQPPSTV